MFMKFIKVFKFITLSLFIFGCSEKVTNIYPNSVNKEILTITDEDFPDEFHRTVFGAIYKIYELGAKTITLENLADFLSSRPKSAAIYKKNDGDKWLLKVADVASQLSFDFYYNRLKKMTLFFVLNVL